MLLVAAETLGVKWRTCCL